MFEIILGNFGAFPDIFGSAKMKISDQAAVMTKRNAMVYSFILGGRLIGIGYRGLSLYHAVLNIYISLCRLQLYFLYYSKISGIGSCVYCYREYAECNI